MRRRRVGRRPHAIADSPTRAAARAQRQPRLFYQGTGHRRGAMNELRPGLGGIAELLRRQRPDGRRSDRALRVLSLSCRRAPTRALPRAQKRCPRRRQCGSDAKMPWLSLAELDATCPPSGRHRSVATGRSGDAAATQQRPPPPNGVSEHYLYLGLAGAEPAPAGWCIRAVSAGRRQQRAGSAQP